MQIYSRAEKEKLSGAGKKKYGIFRHFAGVILIFYSWVNPALTFLSL